MKNNRVQILEKLMWMYKCKDVNWIIVIYKLYNKNYIYQIFFHEWPLDVAHTSTRATSRPFTGADLSGITRLPVGEKHKRLSCGSGGDWHTITKPWEKCPASRTDFTRTPTHSYTKCWRTTTSSGKSSGRWTRWVTAYMSATKRSFYPEIWS